MIEENLERVSVKTLGQDLLERTVLGGHMRCHMAKDLLLERETPLAIDKGSEEARRVGYCLRGNPKKSWKLSGLMENAQENPCLVCNKRFRSTRTLFGHMKIHSRKDDESGDQCEDRSKGSGSIKSQRNQARPIHDRERLNLSLSSVDRYVDLRKTKGDLLLSVLVDDEAMHTTRRKRTPRFSYHVDERTEEVLLSVPNGFSSGREAEQDLENEAAVLLMRICRGEAGFNYPGLDVKPFWKSSARDSFDVEKVRITEASDYNESHSRGYSRMEQKWVEVEVPTSMLYGAREVEHKKPKAARSGEEPMYEAAVMDRDMMGIAGSDSRERAKLWIGPGLNSNRDEVCAEESQVFGESSEENKYKSRDTESYKQDALVDASQGIEGNRGCAELESIKDYSEKTNRHVCSISHKNFSLGQALGGHKRAHYAKNPEANAEMPTSAPTQQRLVDIMNMIDL